MQIKQNGTAKGEHSHPTEEAQIRCLYLRSPAFHHQPKLVTTGEHGTSETLSLFTKYLCYHSQCNVLALSCGCWRVWMFFVVSFSSKVDRSRVPCPPPVFFFSCSLLVFFTLSTLIPNWQVLKWYSRPHHFLFIYLDCHFWKAVPLLASSLGLRHRLQSDFNIIFCCRGAGFCLFLSPPGGKCISLYRETGVGQYADNMETVCTRLLPQNNSDLLTLLLTCVWWWTR